mgnify:CR=1 FL=1
MTREGEGAIGPRPYKWGHLAGSAFERIRGWHGLATCYREWLSSFVAAVQVRCASL